MTTRNGSIILNLYLMNQKLIVCYILEDDEDNVVTTPEPPGLGYNVKVKIVKLGENFVVPQLGSLQYDDLSSRINENFEPLFKKVPGYKKVVIENIKE